MSLLLENKDYCAAQGGLKEVSGGEAVLNEVLFRLTAKRGAFPLMPELGSRFFLLGREKPSARAEMAAQFASEALKELEDVEVTGVRLTQMGELRLRIAVDLKRQGTPLTAIWEEQI